MIGDRSAFAPPPPPSERRRTPRINSYTAADYPAPGDPVPRSSLEQLKRQQRYPGEASFFYYDPHFQHNAVKVLPGEYFVSNKDVILVTVLGSCISACIWDRTMRVGGMNHFMLPDASAESLQAKIIGGGQVMHNFTTMNVGERNTAFVTQYLQTERIPIVSEDVLDIYPRKVVFFPASGKAMVKRLAHAHPEELVQQEFTRGNAAVVARNTAGGSVDLF